MVLFQGNFQKNLASAQTTKNKNHAALFLNAFFLFNHPNMATSNLWMNQQIICNTNALGRMLRSDRNVVLSYLIKDCASNIPKVWQLWRMNPGRKTIKPFKCIEFRVVLSWKFSSKAVMRVNRWSAVPYTVQSYRSSKHTFRLEGVLRQQSGRDKFD